MLKTEYTIKHNLTPKECVRYFKPDWDDKMCDTYLWENTCFPMSIEATIEQLNKQFIKNKKL